MRHFLFIFILFVILCCRTYASRTCHNSDSVSVSEEYVCMIPSVKDRNGDSVRACRIDEIAARRLESEKRFCRFKPTQLIAPVLLVGVGVTGLTVSPIKEMNRNINDYFRKPQYPRIYADDFAQYVPLVSVYGLNLSGVRGRHNYLENTIIIATSYAAMGALVNAVKYTVRERRPDGSARNSFPSRHTATAFMGAEILRMEYRDVSPWIGIGGYVLASGIGLCRVYNHRHWVTDVLAGAGIGILSAKIGYWMFPVWQRLFFSGRKAKKDSYVNCSPYYNGEQLGASFSMMF